MIRRPNDLPDVDRVIRAIPRTAVLNYHRPEPTARRRDDPLDQLWRHIVFIFASSGVIGGLAGAFDPRVYGLVWLALTVLALGIALLVAAVRRPE